VTADKGPQLHEEKERNEGEKGEGGEGERGRGCREVLGRV